MDSHGRSCNYISGSNNRESYKAIDSKLIIIIEGSIYPRPFFFFVINFFGRFNVKSI